MAGREIQVLYPCYSIPKDKIMETEQQPHLLLDLP